jgi:alpha-mannosidase
MNGLAIAVLAVAIGACTAQHGRRGTRSDSDAAIAGDGRALAFQTLSESDLPVDVAVPFASRAVELAAGDVLEYDFYAAPSTGDVRADRAGVEIALENGASVAPPSTEEARGERRGAWVHRTRALDAHAGVKTASFRLTARGARRGALAFYVDDVVIRRASGERVVLFDEAPVSARRETHAGAAAGACFTVTRAERYPDQFVPAGGETPGEPWAFVELSAARRALGNASRDSSSRAHGPNADVELSAHERSAIEAKALALSDAIPSGIAYFDAGVPFRFADPDEVPAVAADGQRVGLGDVIGGRYYDLYLAVAIDGDEPLDTAWRIEGRRGASRPLAVRFDPASARLHTSAHNPSAGARASDRIQRVCVPIAAAFEIESLVLPREPRLFVLAASARWHKDAPADPSFRRRWLMRENGGEPLARYYRNVEMGPLFAFLTGSAVALGERKIFDAALRATSTEFDAELARRTHAFEQEREKFKRARVALFASADAGGGGEIALAHGADASAITPAPADAASRLSSIVDALREFPELRAAMPSMRACAALRERDPAVFEELRRAADERRIDLACGTWSGDGTGGGAEAMARELVLGRAFAAEHFIAPQPATARMFQRDRRSPEDETVLGVLPRDLSYARQLPQLCASANVSTLFRGTSEDSSRPSAFVWTAPDGSSVAACEWRSNSFDRDRPLEEKVFVSSLRRAREKGARPDVLLALDIGASASGAPRTGGGAAPVHDVRGDLAVIDRVNDADLSPSVPFTTPSVWLDSVRADVDVRLPAWDGAHECASRPRAPAISMRVRAANRRAEAALERAERYSTLARGDGLAYPRAEIDALWRELLDAQSLSCGRSSALATDAAIADATLRADALLHVESRAQEIARSALGVLVRSADTNGPGRAIAVYNPLPWERVEPIEIPEQDVDVLDSVLRPVVSQLTSSGTRVFMAQLPSLGRATFHLTPAQASAPALAPTEVCSTDEWTLTNGKVRVVLDPKTGRIASLRLWPSGEELLARDGIGGDVLTWIPFAPGVSASTVIPGAPVQAGATVQSGAPSSDGLSSALPPGAPVRLDTVDSIRILERGPVRSLARVERTWNGARIVQEIALFAGESELTIETRIDGNLDAGRLISTFELKHSSPWLVHGVPFGFATVPCTGGGAGDVRALDWVAQSAPQCCFTLCNDAGATFAADGRRVSVTLDERTGEHDAAPREIACTVHVGKKSWRITSMHAAAELEHPPQIVRPEPHEGARPALHSFVHVARLAPNGHPIEGPRSGLMLTALKIAEDGDDWVLRVFESTGQAGTVRLTFDRPMFSAQRTDLLERPLEPLAVGRREIDLHIGAYRVETVRVNPRPR